MNFRIGEGWDVHALVPGRKLMLGGVNVPHTAGLLGHSDADVLLHAITDAVLGAAGLGDIGRHFPDTDPQFKGADSSVLLAEAMRRVRQQGWELVNVDSTIVAQAPKLAPHMSDIQAGVAKALGVAPDQVNVKAKTAEKLGPVGQGQSMEARAVVLFARSDQRDHELSLSSMVAISPPWAWLNTRNLPPMRSMARSTIASPRPEPMAAVRAALPR